MNRLFLYLFFGLLLQSCINAPDYPDEPVIEFISNSRLSLDQGDLNTDSLFLKFSFTDGDGDLGQNPQDTAKNIFLKDLRTGFIVESYKSPFIPEEGIGNGITGDIELLVYTSCCIFPDLSIPPCSSPEQYPLDTIIYEIFMKDRAGNESNKIKTDPIIIRCIQ